MKPPIDYIFYVQNHRIVSIQKWFLHFNLCAAKMYYISPLDFLVELSVVSTTAGVPWVWGSAVILMKILAFHRVEQAANTVKMTRNVFIYCRLLRSINVKGAGTEKQSTYRLQHDLMLARHEIFVGVRYV